MLIQLSNLRKKKFIMQVRFLFKKKKIIFDCSKCEKARKAELISFQFLVYSA